VSSPRRIAFCITDLDAGGAERALVQTVTGLAGAEWAPKVFCLSGPGELVAPLEACGIPVECLGATSGWSLGVVRRLARGLREWRPQLVQTFMFHANLAGRAAAWRARVPIVVSGLRVAERDAPWRMRLDRWTQRLVTCNVAVSQGVADFSERDVGIPRHKLRVIPNGVDAKSFRAAQPGDLTRFGIPTGARVITSVGRLHPQKAPLDLMTAAAPLLAEQSNLHLLFVGEGPLRSQLEESSQRLGVFAQVHFAGKQPETASLWKASSVGVLASHWEGMPNVLLEAMASGCPVVASDVEGSCELVKHGETGRLFPAGDTAALSCELRWVFEHPRETSAAAVAAQHIVETEFTWTRVIESYCRLYVELLSPAAECG
jgi:glycosyltransferase involved in cell wall biosynthesis